MRTCFICKNGINNNDGKHIYNCSKKHGIDLSKKEIKFNYIQYNFPEISNKQKLFEVYELNLKSLTDIKLLYGIDFKSILFLLEYYNIRKRSISESALKISNSKHQTTCRLKYGVNNISQVYEIKNKKRKTFLKNYGVDNIRKSPDFYEYIRKTIELKYNKTWSELASEKSKFVWKNKTDEEKNEWLKKSIHNFENIKKSCLNKYGVEHYTQTEYNKRRKSAIEKIRYNNKSDDEKNEMVRRFINNFSSKLESRVEEILFLTDLKFKRGCFIAGKQFDFLVEKLFLLEVNGDYWHANPEKYKSTDIIKYPGNKLIFAENIWEKDYDKKQIAKKYGYDVLYLWEKDINAFKTNNELKNYILKKIENKLNEISKT